MREWWPSKHRTVVRKVRQVVETRPAQGLGGQQDRRAAERKDGDKTHIRIARSKIPPDGAPEGLVRITWGLEERHSDAVEVLREFFNQRFTFRHWQGTHTGHVPTRDDLGECARSLLNPKGYKRRVAFGEGG
jgi:hypothetical protein